MFGSDCLNTGVRASGSIVCNKKKSDSNRVTHVTQKIQIVKKISLVIHRLLWRAATPRESGPSEDQSDSYTFKTSLFRAHFAFHIDTVMLAFYSSQRNISGTNSIDFVILALCSRLTRIFRSCLKIRKTAH